MKGGYGQFKTFENGRQKHWAAHRWAWSEANGSIPAMMVICHRCDNPACVNPGHLFLGSQRDNVIDMLLKRRGAPARGVAQPAAKLTDDAVREIRRLINVDHVARMEVAKRYGVHQSTARKIALGVLWAHVPMEHPAWLGRPSLMGSRRGSTTIDARGWIRCGRCREFKTTGHYSPSAIKRGYGYCRLCAREYAKSPWQKREVAA